VWELKFQELTVEGIKLKIKTIHAAELAKVIKSAKSGAGPHYLCTEIVLVQTSTFIAA
jgi:hypothetical protein